MSTHAEEALCRLNMASPALKSTQSISEEAALISSPNKTNATPQSEIPPELPLWRYSFISLALAIGLFLSLLDSTIVATAIYTLSLEFGSLSTSFWVVLGYILGYLSFATVFARASDLSGRRPAFIASLVIFFAASLGCGWSPNLNALIACRAVQGLGGSGLYALGIVVLVEITPDRRRPMIAGMIGFIIAVAGAVGPLVGGAFTTYVTWRWIFWMNGPITGLALILFLIGWPSGLDKDSERRPFRQFDWVGTILLIAASCLVVFGLQRAAGGLAAWNSAQVIAALVIGCLSWFGLFAWEYCIRNTSIAAAFPVLILERRRMCAGICTTLFIGFVSFTMLYFIPLRFQLVNGASPSAAGVRLLPLLGSSAVFSFLSGMVNRITNRCTWTFTIAAALTMLGSGLMTTLPTTADISAKEYGFQVILGAGQGLTYSTVSMMVSFETSKADSAVVQGVAAQVRILGGSIGIAAANGLLTRQLTVALAGVLSPEMVSALENSNESFRILTAQQADLARSAYADAFTDSMRVCIYVSVAALVASGFTWQRNPPHPVGDRIKQAKANAKAQKAGEDTSTAAAHSRKWTIGKKC